jgi:hypothetical protein
LKYNLDGGIISMRSKQYVYCSQQKLFGEKNIPEVIYDFKKEID